MGSRVSAEAQTATMYEVPVLREDKHADNIADIHPRTHCLLSNKEKVYAAQDNKIKNVRDILTIAYQNVRGLNTKTAEFFNSVCLTTDEYDIVAISETWLSDDGNVRDAELFPEDYFVLRSRSRAAADKGGGVLLGVKKVYRSCVVPIASGNPNIDILCVKVYTGKTNFIYIMVLYIAPSCTLYDRESLYNKIENLDYLYNNRFIIVGDFNIPRLNEFYNSNSVDNSTALLLNFQNFFGVEQVNRVCNNNKHILDLVISTLHCEVERNTISFVREDDHHPTLVINAPLNEAKCRDLVLNNDGNYNFRKANFGLMYDSFANLDWSDLVSVTDVNLAVKLFYDKVYEIFNMCVPKSKKSKQYPPWFSKSIISNIKKKEKFRKRLRKTNSLETKHKFIELRAQLKRDINVSYHTYLLGQHTKWHKG